MILEEYLRIRTLSDGSTEEEITYPENFNFGWDVVSRIASRTPEKRALIWCNDEGDERTFTFGDIDRESSKLANALIASGIGRGKRVALTLKRHWSYWLISVALHKIGAVMIPMTNMLTPDDFAYRFSASDADAVIAAPEASLISHIREGAVKTGNDIILWTVEDGFGLRNIMKEAADEPEYLQRPETSAHDDMVIYFTSGTTGYPKAVIHDFTYPLAHIITARDWQKTRDGGLHFTVAETGWAKASWGKIYGQWLTESAVMAYDFDTFDPLKLASVINRFSVTSFCAPPTVYRYLAKKGIPELPSLESASTAGEYLSPEVFRLFYEKTGLKLREGYGQSETVLLTADFSGDAEPGSMGRPSPLFSVFIQREDGTEAATGEIGEIVVRPKEDHSLGIFTSYLDNPELYSNVWRGGVYHTGDTGWKDEKGLFWFHGRADDVIKSGGFRIGPGEIENILLEHPAVIECSVIGIPDRLRGQAIKAFVVLSDKAEASDKLRNEIREFCNTRLAEYKWIRHIEFSEELPKTISGKIRRSELRNNAF